MLRHSTLYAFETKGGYQFASVPAGGSYSDAQPENQIGGANLVEPTGTDDTYIFGDYAPMFGLVLSYLTKDKDVRG